MFGKNLRGGLGLGHFSLLGHFLRLPLPKNYYKSYFFSPCLNLPLFKCSRELYYNCYIHYPASPSRVCEIRGPGGILSSVPYFMLIARQKICYYSHEISQFSNLFWPKLFQSHFYKTLRRHLFLPITNNWTHTCGFYSESSRPDAFWFGINFMWLDIIFECGILN